MLLVSALVRQGRNTNGPALQKQTHQSTSVTRLIAQRSVALPVRRRRGRFRAQWSASASGETPPAEARGCRGGAQALELSLTSALGTGACLESPGRQRSRHSPDEGTTWRHTEGSARRTPPRVLGLGKGLQRSLQRILLVLEELDVHPLAGRMVVPCRPLDAVPMSLVALVMGRMVLRLRHRDR